MTQRITSPEDQSATFVELFFDLVFVFSITQIVGLLHDGITPTSVGLALLVFWLVWWAWTQFTWALNAADTTHYLIEIGTLIATAVAFFMAIALPDAFEGRALWFALPYIAVRAIGLGLYIWVASENESQAAAVRGFALLSIGGLAAVFIGAILGGEAQPWLWGLAILLDVIAANFGGQAEGWALHPEHFAERHGLFVIIALGETLIVAASGVAGAEWTTTRLLLAVMAVAITCGLWWSYFPLAMPALEHMMGQKGGAAQATLARDSFTLLHFPMLVGVIAYAVAIEEIVAHPGDPLPLEGRLALALGLLLFVGGMALSLRRATGHWLRPRLLIALGMAAVVVLLAGVPPLVTLLVAFAGLLALLLIEQRPGSLLVTVHEQWADHDHPTSHAPDQVPLR